MLQICSGKLFQREIEYRNNLRGVIFTNLRLSRDSRIDTAAGSLLSTSAIGESYQLFYEIEELIESSGFSGPGVLVSHAIDPYILDFSTLLSFILNCTATPSYVLTDRLLSDRRGLSTHVAPKQVVRRTFDKCIFVQEQDSETLVEFVKHLIGLQRREFLGVMRAIRTFVTGMHRLADDFELGYTLLVASIESLAQDFDGHEASWDRYDERKRKAIDLALDGAGQVISGRVREALLEFEHTSLSRRFRDFSLRYVNPAFYREEAVESIGPISQFDLSKALGHAYQARSNYIHKLQKLPALVTMVPNSYSETCRADDETWLTVQGLARLGRHIIINFVRDQKTVNQEIYDYNLERAGVMRAPLAPHFWLARPDFREGAGSKKLEGFLSQYAVYILGQQEAKFTDLAGLLVEVNRKIHQIKKEDKLSYAALYVLFKGMFPDDPRIENLEALETHGARVADTISPIGLLIRLLFDVHEASWDTSRERECLLGYLQQRNNKFQFRAPKIIESGMILQLAERFRLDGDYSASEELIKMAVENDPGNIKLMKFETIFGASYPKIDWREILFDTEFPASSNR